MVGERGLAGLVIAAPHGHRTTDRRRGGGSRILTYLPMSMASCKGQWRRKWDGRVAHPNAAVKPVRGAALVTGLPYWTPPRSWWSAWATSASWNGFRTKAAAPAAC